MGIGLTLMAINPRSRNPASAIAYIEEYVKHIDPGKQAMMNPGLNDHILNPRYEEEAEALEATRLYYETELRKAQGAEKRNLSGDTRSNINTQTYGRKRSGTASIRKRSLITVT